VTIDNFSDFLVATTLIEKATKNVIICCLHYFSMLGVPIQIKTDNETSYYSQAFEMFYRQFNITHITGIPYCPKGQGIVEHAQTYSYVLRGFDLNGKACAFEGQELGTGCL
jgi:transposase InsO family protein